MAYDAGWKGKWIHAPYRGQKPEPKHVTIQQPDQDAKPLLYVVQNGLVIPLTKSKKAGF
jgi:hypothetical protein